MLGRFTEWRPSRAAWQFGSQCRAAIGELNRLSLGHEYDAAKDHRRSRGWLCRRDTLDRLSTLHIRNPYFRDGGFFYYSTSRISFGCNFRSAFSQAVCVGSGSDSPLDSIGEKDIAEPCAHV